MADDVVKEEIEDYKEEDVHFYSSVDHGYDDQNTRLVFAYWAILLLNILFHGNTFHFV